ncbi:MAG: ABC transporter ATP-binding protein [Erysipelotrichaceae bacterium]|nr:ABC transporter ATP-binding protein [Erysipelotrichaceae bacterium]
MAKLIEIKNLHTYFDTKKGLVKAVNGVSFSLEHGRTLGVVGESGSGKSQTAMSILKLFEKNQKIYDGQIIFDGVDITNFSETEMAKIRGNDVSVIFQEPMTSLNPVFTINKQISEVLMLHQGLSKKDAEDRALEMLKLVRINNPENVNKSYPFQLSGGMRQRVMIAMALACKPKLLIADEPTTALDVTIQAQILKLMNELKKETGTSIMFITHDLGVINQMADDIVVMYKGKIVESAPRELLFEKNKFLHPYTLSLLKAIPRIKTRLRDETNFLNHNPLILPEEYTFEEIENQEPELYEVEENHFIRCYRKGK